MIDRLCMMGWWVLAQTGAAGPTRPGGGTGAASATGATGGTGAQNSFQKAETFAESAAEWLKKNGPSVVGAILLFAAAWIIASWVRRIIRRATSRTHVDPTLGKFFSNVARWLIVTLAALSCLRVFGIETTGFAALIGAAGLAIGLGFQGSLGNFSSGVMLLLFRPFKVGDTVVLAGQAGIVNEIDLLITELDTPDGRRILIPNGQIFGAVIENTSHHPRRRVDVNFVLPHAADLDETRRVLEGAAGSLKPALHSYSPEVALTDIAAANVTWAVRVWTNNSDYGAAKDALIREVRYGLEKAGVPIVAPAPAPAPPPAPKA